MIFTNAIALCLVACLASLAAATPIPSPDDVGPRAITVPMADSGYMPVHERKVADTALQATRNLISGQRPNQERSEAQLATLGLNKAKSERQPRQSAAAPDFTLPRPWAVEGGVS
jgi:hypothetical protein